MAEFFVIMLAGSSGSFHCIGMCGGFACGLGANLRDSRLQAVLRHLLYNSGRLVTYMFIGALAGTLGSSVVGHDMQDFHDGTASGASHAGVGVLLAGDAGTLQRALSVVAGALMLVMAMQLFGLIRHRPRTWLGVHSEWISSSLGSLLISSRRSAPVALGVMNGFLPCPLVYAFAALAAATGSTISGVFTMAALGLGTFPAMLLMASVGRTLSPARRRIGVRMAGSFVLVVGAFTLVRGAAPSLLPWQGHGM